MLSGKAAYIRVGNYKPTRECKRPLLFSLSLAQTGLGVAGLVLLLRLFEWRKLGRWWARG